MGPAPTPIHVYPEARSHDFLTSADNSPRWDVVLDRVTGASSPLDAALFSSAAQRLLRNRSPHTRHLEGAHGGLSAAAALAAAS